MWNVPCSAPPADSRRPLAVAKGSGAVPGSEAAVSGGGGTEPAASHGAASGWARGELGHDVSPSFPQKTLVQPNDNDQGAETPAETPLHTQRPPPAQPQEALILAEELQPRVRRPQHGNSAPHRPPFPYPKVSGGRNHQPHRCAGGGWTRPDPLIPTGKRVPGRGAAARAAESPAQPRLHRAQPQPTVRCQCPGAITCLLSAACYQRAPCIGNKAAGFCCLLPGVERLYSVCCCDIPQRSRAEERGRPGGCSLGLRRSIIAGDLRPGVLWVPGRTGRGLGGSRCRSLGARAHREGSRGVPVPFSGCPGAPGGVSGGPGAVLWVPGRTGRGLRGSRCRSVVPGRTGEGFGGSRCRSLGAGAHREGSRGVPVPFSGCPGAPGGVSWGPGAVLWVPGAHRRGLGGSRCRSLGICADCCVLGRQEQGKRSGGRGLDSPARPALKLLLRISAKRDRRGLKQSKPRSRSRLVPSPRCPGATSRGLRSSAPAQSPRPPSVKAVLAFLSPAPVRFQPRSNTCITESYPTAERSSQKYSAPFFTLTQESHPPPSSAL
ncbi:uncharacterized protein [Sylvia atricapilla]|uniref:uncharacterized protein n=1 Tax=Sylvia atricapilla TaxID=48155 RepID=UPI003396C0AE